MGYGSENNQLIKVDISEEVSAQLAETTKNKDFNILSLSQYESYKIVAAESYDYGPALRKLTEDLPSIGGTIIIPNGEFNIVSDVWNGYTYLDRKFKVK